MMLDMNAECSVKLGPCHICLLYFLHHFYYLPPVLTEPRPYHPLLLDGTMSWSFPVPFTVSTGPVSSTIGLLPQFQHSRHTRLIRTFNRFHVDPSPQCHRLPAPSVAIPTARRKSQVAGSRTIYSIRQVSQPPDGSLLCLQVCRRWVLHRVTG